MLQLKFVAEPIRKKTAQPISKNVWEKHKAIILREFHEHGIARAKEYMRIQHQFIATDDQWNYRLYRVWKVTQYEHATSQPGPLQKHAGAELLAPHNHAVIIPDANSPSTTTLHAPLKRRRCPTVIFEDKISTPLSRAATEAARIIAEDGAVIRQSRSFDSERSSGTGYTGSSALPSTSSRSASPYERSPSAASSYYTHDGSKRAGSVSSVSSAPSLKRFKSTAHHSIPSTPLQQAAYDSTLLNHQDFFNASAIPNSLPRRLAPQVHTSLASIVPAGSPSEELRSPIHLNASTTAYQETTKSTLSGVQDVSYESADVVSVAEHRARSFHALTGSIAPHVSQKEEPRRHAGLPVARTELTVLHKTGTTAKGSAPIRRRVIDVTHVQSDTDASVTVEVESLTWEEMHQLKDAVAVLTAGKMHTQAFKIHFQLCNRLQDAETCPWGNLGELNLSQVLSSSRTAEANLDLHTCRRMLNEELKKPFARGNVSHQLQLLMALADICMRQEDDSGMLEHRASACELLRCSDESAIFEEANDSPDFLSGFAILRAFALRAAMDTLLKNNKRSSKDSKEDEAENVRRATEHIENQIARLQMRGINKVIKWCRIKLYRVKVENLTFLRTCLGREPPSITSNTSLRRLNLVAVFGILLMQEDEASVQHKIDTIEQLGAMFGGTRHESHGLEDLVISTPADVLWMIAALIVGSMKTETMLKVLSKDWIEEAQRVASHLLEIPGQKLSARIFKIIKGELLSSSIQSWAPKLNSEHTANDPWLNAASKLLMAIVRKEYCVVLEDHAVALADRVPLALSAEYPLLASGLIAETTTNPRISARYSKTSNSSRDSRESHALTNTSGSGRSNLSWASMKRIRDQTAKKSFFTLTDLVPSTPTKYMKEAFKKLGRNHSIYGISQSLHSTSLSDPWSPRQSYVPTADGRDASPYKASWVTHKALRELHERVDALLARS